jgi:regulator of extracellular matrix RemA (YlzA/DUF370 family)
MILHIGGEIVVEGTRLVAILDEKSVNSSGYMTKFIQDAKNRGEIRAISHELCRSYVILDDAIYASPISSDTLMARANIF